MKQYTTVILFIITLLLPFLGYSQDEGADAANRFFQNGEILRKSKQFVKAIEEYDHALVINDKLYPAFYSKGMCYYYLNDSIQAAENIENAIALKPDFLKGYMSLVKIYSESSNLDKLVYTYDRMVETTTKKGKKVDFKLKAAKVLLKEREYHKAHKYAKEAVEIDNNNYDALYYDAKINNLIGNYEIAEKDMQNVLKYLSTRDPKVTAKLYYELGLAYHKQGKFDESKTAFEKARYGPFKSLVAKLQPNYYYGVASGLAKVFELDKAKEILDIALNIDPHFSNGNKLLGEIAIKKEHHSKAIHHYKRAIKGEENKNKKYVLYINVIEIEINSKKYADAIKTADECLKIYPDNKKELEFLKSIALFKHNRQGDAIATIEDLLIDATLTQMELVKFNFSAGIMYLNQKEYLKANEAFRKARRGPFASASQYEIDLILEKTAK